MRVYFDKYFLALNQFKKQIFFNLNFIVQGEEDKETVTVGSVVTLKITLKRHSLLDGEKRVRELDEGSQINSLNSNKYLMEKEVEPKEENEGDETQQLLTKRKVWEKQPKKKTKKGGKSGAKVNKKINAIFFGEINFVILKFRILKKFNYINIPNF